MYNLNEHFVFEKFEEIQERGKSKDMSFAEVRDLVLTLSDKAMIQKSYLNPNDIFETKDEKDEPIPISQSFKDGTKYAFLSD